MSDEPKQLSEKCCAKCLYWSPNRRPDFKEGETKLCWKHDEAREDEDSCAFFIGSDATEVNVPQHTPKGIMIERNRPMPEVKCEGLIVTYATPTMRVSGRVVSELAWLDYSIRSWEKWCKGFQGLTIAHPRHETHLFANMAEKYNVKLLAYDEFPKKGFVQHQAMMALADTFLPDTTTHVLHFDADCIWKMETTPMDFFYKDKPIYLWRPYETLITVDPRNPSAKVVSDCYQWKIPTEKQLGFPTEAYTMTRHPSIYPINFYRKYRDHIEKIQHKPFLQFHLDSKNEHPSGSMDFTAMGAYCFKEMHDSFHWFNCETDEYPVDRLQAYWSHGGLNLDIVKQIEDLISGKEIGNPILLG